MAADKGSNTGVMEASGRRAAALEPGGQSVIGGAR